MELAENPVVSDAQLEISADDFDPVDILTKSEMRSGERLTRRRQAQIVRARSFRKELPRVICDEAADRCLIGSDTKIAAVHIHDPAIGGS